MTKFKAEDFSAEAEEGNYLNYPIDGKNRCIAYFWEEPVSAITKAKALLVDHCTIEEYKEMADRGMTPRAILDAIEAGL